MAGWVGGTWSSVALLGPTRSPSSLAPHTGSHTPTFAAVQFLHIHSRVLVLYPLSPRKCLCYIKCQGEC